MSNIFCFRALEKQESSRHSLWYGLLLHYACTVKIKATLLFQWSLKNFYVVDPDDYPEYVAEEKNPKIFERGISFYSLVFFFIFNNLKR